MKVRKFLLPILILFLFGTYVSAHPGSTDGDGGHFDHSSGEYHYHHGYPAHEHSDGECPYDFDDKTNHNTHKEETSDDNYSHYIDNEGTVHRIYNNQAIEDNPLFQKVPDETAAPDITPAPTQNKNSNNKIFKHVEIVLCVIIFYSFPVLLIWTFKLIAKAFGFFRDVIRENKVKIISVCVIIGIPMCLLLARDGSVTIDSFIFEAIPSIFSALIGAFLLLVNIAILNVMFDTELSESFSSFFVFGGFITFVLCNFFLDNVALSKISTALFALTFLNFIACIIKEKFFK